MQKTTAFALLLGLLAISGCQTAVKPTAADQSAARQRAAADKRVVMDPDLGRAVHILGVHAINGADGYLRIQLDLQNVTDSGKSFIYIIQWLDQDQLRINLPVVAIPWSLRSREMSSLFASAPTPLAKNFRLIFANAP